MSDDEADPELLELLRQTLGLGVKRQHEISSDTGVLRDAEYIYNNAIDVHIDMYGTRAAAASIATAMQERAYSTKTWSEHELHPTINSEFSAVDLVNFIFTMDLLNFSFWSERGEDDRFQAEYRNRRWTGYNSLVACLRRALDEGIPITNPSFWNDERCTDAVIVRVFRSASDEDMPLLKERIALLREAGQILHEEFGEAEAPGAIDTEMLDPPSFAANGQSPHINSNLEESTGLQNGHDQVNGAVEGHTTSPAVENGTADHVSNLDSTSLPTEQAQAASPSIQLPVDTSVIRLVEKADGSAGKLVNLLAHHFPAFRDETRFEGRRVRLLKRAQIFVADLWAAFQGSSYGSFKDVGHLTMFADYRIPQMLHALGVLAYSPPLEYRIKTQQLLEPGHSWEVQLRGCSIWAVELIRREIVRRRAEDSTAAGPAPEVNAVLIDFFLYDLAKEQEADGRQPPRLAHHRCRSIWY